MKRHVARFRRELRSMAADLRQPWFQHMLIFVAAVWAILVGAIVCLVVRALEVQ